MRKVYLELNSLLDQQINEEEFKLWDAQRNGCSIEILKKIEEKIKILKAEAGVLPELRLQACLS